MPYNCLFELDLQPEFELQPAYRTSSGNYVRPIKYRADFTGHKGSRL
ncbi:DUF1064 domain-containing protein [Desulfoscipio gibsoniae]